MKMMQAKESAGAAQDAARDVKGKGLSESARMAALSAGQAAAVAHVAAHELGAAAYAIRAVMESVVKTEREGLRQAECAWQRSRLSDEIRGLVLDDQRLRNEICWFAFEQADEN
jgi:hypothetical protein